MDAKESLVSLVLRVRLGHMEHLVHLDKLVLVVFLEREAVPDLVVPLVLVVLMVTLDPPALLVLLDLLVPPVSLEAPDPRERLVVLDPQAQADLREAEESPVPMALLAPLVPLVTPVTMV